MDALQTGLIVAAAALLIVGAAVLVSRWLRCRLAAAQALRTAGLAGPPQRRG